MNLWSSPDAWQSGGENLYRHKDAYYFLPSENEWYKSAYYNPDGLNYFDYATGSDAAPTAVASGTEEGTAVYNFATSSPASVDSAGGLSPFGTMGQSGNVWEFNESAYTPPNDSPFSDRVIRGGRWGNATNALSSSYRDAYPPTLDDFASFGFRVASVPEPSTYALLLLTGAGALWLARRRR